MMRWIDRILSILAATLLLVTLTRSEARPIRPFDRVYMLSYQHGFDFTSWTANAIWVKMSQAALGSPRYFLASEQARTVTEYQRLTIAIDEVEYEIEKIYADPNNPDPQSNSAAQRARLADLTRQMEAVAPLAEASMEEQVSEILRQLELTTIGQPLPWVLYHVTPLPQNLVVSRRDKIQQLTSMLIEPDLTLEEAENLEASVQDKIENTSTLVVPVGGVATYPTMVMRTRNLTWTASTVAHEWIHLYLQSMPLGSNYSKDPNVRTMNETTASIAGDEIGLMVMQRFYPELLHRYDPARQVASLDANFFRRSQNFDFNREMHLTRMAADALLAEGKIEQAEEYMEARRKVFWNHGYLIRKINQAYFSFYGAYADQPGGAAGEDPVGPAVRQLRERSKTLKEFLETIGAMDSFADLQAALGQP